MKKYKKILYRLIPVFFFLFLFSMNTTYATADFWDAASDWFKGVNPNQTNENILYIVQEFNGIVRSIGTTVITGVTIFLGIKYIFGSVESKSDVKEGLVTLFIVCVFFFGWSSIANLLFPNNKFIFVSTNDNSYESVVGRVFATFTYIAQFVVLIAIIYVGVRYIFAGVQGKSDLKAKSPMFFIGIILAFSSSAVLGFISDIINESIK